jgi:hypothetical protein
VDLSCVDYIDSSGIASLVEGQQECQKRNIRFALAGMTLNIEAVFDLAKVNSGGGTASLSPFRRSPPLHRGSLPPLLGGHEPAPCDQRGIPPWNSRLICLPVASHGACNKSVKGIFAVFPGVEHALGVDPNFRIT